MKWITEKQVIAAAKKSHKAAVAMSRKHWLQLSTATKAEIIKAYEKNLVDVCGDDCALCGRYGKADGECADCPLLVIPQNTGCCQEWQDAMILFNPNLGHRWKHRAFQKAAKKMYERLCEF